MSRGRAALAALARTGWVVWLAHLPVALWIFGGLLFGGRVLFFRDLSIYYYPNYVFLEGSLAAGVWPLWNPTADAGAPFLLTDPVDLLLVWLFGANGAFALGPPLHTLIAMCGASVLARALGAGSWGSWGAGLLYGLSGPLLSAVNLVELFHAACWAPAVVAAFLRLWSAPGPGRAAVLAALGAVQLATLSAEMLLQTAALGLALARGRPTRHRLGALALAGLACGLLAAPALLGARSLVEGTAREAGFAHQVSFAWSAWPVRLLETALPRVFGDTHRLTELGYFGQPLFPTGLPYLLSFYLGVSLLLLAALAGRGGSRLYAIAAAGALLALGDRGPLGPLMEPWMGSLRIPVKFFLASTLALCLLAGLGLERVRTGMRRVGLAAVAPGLLLLALALVARLAPDLPLGVLQAISPDLAGMRAREVIAGSWPAGFALSGALAVAAGLALHAAPRLAPLAALLAALDLAAVNDGINPQAPADFYTLRAPLAELVEQAEREGRYRWFSYGVAYSPGVRYAPDLLRLDSDVWLYYLDRQTLLPRTPGIDGLDSAFDLDRVGWSPRGSTMTVAGRTPARFAAHASRLRLANVRWVLSFAELPAAAVAERARVVLPEVVQPLRLYELRDPLPRALGVPRGVPVGGRATAFGRARRPGFDPRALALLEGATGLVVGEGPRPVRLDRPDPHTIRLRWERGSGVAVVLENHHPAWQAEIAGARVPVYRANGQHLALAVPEGPGEAILRFTPPWRAPALAASLVGLLGTLLLACSKRRRPVAPIT